MASITPTTKLVRPNVKDLKLTTIAMVLYSNTVNDPSSLFSRLKVPIMENVPRKKGKIDKKSIRAPRGQIISARWWDRFKGLNFKEGARHWCANTCQLMDDDSESSFTNMVDKYPERDGKLLTMHEVYTLISDDGTFLIQYHCEHCHQMYNVRDMKNTITFRNQVQLDISLGDYNINVMCFKSCYKIVGCRNFDDGFEFMRILLKHINHDPGAIHVAEQHTRKNMMEFECRVTMFNTKFYLGVPIDRTRFKQLMNRPEYSKYVVDSSDESTANPQVKTSMYGYNWALTKEDYIAHPNNKNVYRYIVYDTSTGKSGIKKRPYLRYVSKKKTNQGKVTMVTFSSSQTIISGSNYNDLEYCLTNFFNIVEPNLETIRECID